MKRVIILKGDDWQACYVDGKSIKQAHHLGEGMGLIQFINEASKKHNFTLDDVEEMWIDDIDEEISCDAGQYPDNFSDLKGDYSNERT